MARIPLSGHQPLTRREIADLEVPDLTHIILAVGEEVYNRRGDPIALREMLDQFVTAFGRVVDAIKDGQPLPEAFFVPDLWHLSFGDAAQLPRQEGRELWAAGVLAGRVGVTFYGARIEARSHNYPGHRWEEPLAEPNYGG